MDKVLDTVTDNDKDMEINTDSTQDMFTDILQRIDTDMASDTATETDMDKNYQGLGGFDSPGAVVNWKCAKIGLESVLIK